MSRRSVAPAPPEVGSLASFSDSNLTFSRVATSSCCAARPTSRPLMRSRACPLARVGWCSNSSSESMEIWPGRLAMNAVFSSPGSDISDACAAADPFGRDVAENPSLRLNSEALPLLFGRDCAVPATETLENVDVVLWWACRIDFSREALSIWLSLGPVLPSPFKSSLNSCSSNDFCWDRVRNCRRYTCLRSMYAIEYRPKASRCRARRRNAAWAMRTSFHRSRIRCSTQRVSLAALVASSLSFGTGKLGLTPCLLDPRVLKMVLVAL